MHRLELVLAVTLFMVVAGVSAGGGFTTGHGNPVPTSPAASMGSLRALGGLEGNSGSMISASPGVVPRGVPPLGVPYVADTLALFNDSVLPGDAPVGNGLSPS